MIGNPVLHKELMMRLRLRQMPLPTKIGIATAVFGGLTLFYGVIGKMLLDSTSESAGHDAWGWSVMLQFVLVCLVAPVITANCITQEREQQTWEMLVFTRLTPGEILFGKLIARLSIVFIGLALLFPITAFAWIHYAVMDTHIAGSAKLSEFLMCYAVIVVSAVFYATVGLFMSWQVKKTLYAIMLSYTLVIGFLFIGTGLVYIALQTRFTDSTFLVKCPLMWVNPGYLIGFAFVPDTNSNSNLFVLYGLLCYVAGTAALLWRMTLGFYQSADNDEDPANAKTYALSLIAANAVTMMFGWIVFWQT